MSTFPRITLFAAAVGLAAAVSASQLLAQEAQKAAAMNDAVLSRPWELWVREVGPID